MGRVAEFDVGFFVTYPAADWCIRYFNNAIEVAVIKIYMEKRRGRPEIREFVFGIFCSRINPEQFNIRTVITKETKEKLNN